MNPRVRSVTASPNFTVKIIFTNDEQKLFDVKPYLNSGIFTELKNQAKFATVKVENGTISWEGGQDFCPDTLYLEGV